MSKINGRLIIIDPSLKDVRGHHYSLTCNISIAASKIGYDVLVLSNQNVDSAFAVTGASVVPTFGMTTYDHFIKSRESEHASLFQKVRQKILNHTPQSIRGLLRHVRSIFIVPVNLKVDVNHAGNNVLDGGIVPELASSFQELKITSKDHVLVHTCDAIIYRSILELVQINRELGENVNYHLCTPYDMSIMPHSSKGISVDRVIGYLDKMGRIGKNVFLYAENDLLAEELSANWGVEVEVLHIPIQTCQLANQRKSVINENSFRVVYLGAAREEKGFHLLPEIIDEVSLINKKDLPIEFIIQSSPQIVGYTEKVKKTIEQLERFDSCKVKLIMHQQGMSEYYRLLESSDVVLLCYDKFNYKVRGSGIVAEAIAFGKNVIVTPNTYPAWLAGDAALAATEVDKIAAAIVQISENRAEFRKKAESRAKWFCRLSSPDGYMEKILASESAIKSSRSSECTSLDNGGSKRDAMATENRYNIQLCGANVSEDGKKMFVKQM